jgi:N-acetylglucosamine-6-sulfatase
VHGVTANEVNDLPSTITTFPQTLQRAGYRTGFVGKWHQARWSTPRPGFDYWASFNGQGDYRRNTLNVNGDWLATDRYVTDVLTDHALAFLDQRHDGPRLLCLSHKAVHSPCVPAPRHEGLYDDVRIDPLTAQPNLRPVWAGSQPAIDRAEYLRAFAATLAAVDESTGRLLDEVGERALVVYASDSGYMCGEHGGMWDKRVAYEGSIRIPLLISHPGQIPAGTVCDELALNIDVAPTILAAAGLPATGMIQGSDLLPVISGHAGRDGFLYEYFQEDGPVPTTLAVRTRRHKLITFPRNPDLGSELYDLDADPGEEHNHIRDAGYARVLDELTDELARRQRETDFRMIENAPRR